MRLTTLCLTVLLSLPLLAEHLPGGNITYRCTGANVHEITLQLWRECTGAAITGQTLDFVSDCGVVFSLANIPQISMEEVSPICPDQADETTCNGGSLTGIELYTFRTTLYMSPCALWTVSWNTCCRYPAVNLISTQGLYVEAKIVNPNGECTVSPIFSDDQPPYVCVDQPVSYDLGVVSQPGQTLRYHLIEARRQTGTAPIVAESVFYQAPYTGTEPYTGMVIDSLTGNISFVPTLQGYVVCVVEVSVYNDQGVWIGSVMRDFPFVVQACANNVPDATSGTVSNLNGAGETTSDYEITACGGGQICFDITVADLDATQSLVLTSNVDQALSGATFIVTGTNPAVAMVCWNTDGALPGTYNFTVSAVDDACPTPGSQTYTYTLTVSSGTTVSAGDDVSTGICSAGSVDLSLLMNGDPGGAWSDGPIVFAAGTYTYTVTGACGSDEATFIVTDTAPANAGPDASATICAGTSIDLNTLVTGDPGGDWGGPSVVNAAGMYMYTVSNNCGSDMAHFVVAVVQAPDAGLDNSITICSDAAPLSLFAQLLGSPQAGGTWAVNGAPHSAIYNPGVDQPGVACYTVMGIAPCANDVSCITIAEIAAPDAGLDNTIGYCPSAVPFAMLDSLLGTPDAGGSWTAQNNQAHGLFYDPASDPTGVYCYTVDGSAPCADATACLTILALPTTDPYCIGLGTSNIAAPAFTLAPNPNNGRLRIDGLRVACTQVEVLDMQGRRIHVASPNASGPIDMDLPASMADGSYLLRVRSADGTTSTHRFELLR